MAGSTVAICSVMSVCNERPVNTEGMSNEKSAETAKYESWNTKVGLEAQLQQMVIFLFWL
jgi:hypothetical protein